MVCFDVDHGFAYRHRNGDKTATERREKKSIQKSGTVYVAYQGWAWMNSELILKWIILVFAAVLNSCGGKWSWGTRCEHIQRRTSRYREAARKSRWWLFLEVQRRSCRQKSSEYSSSLKIVSPAWVTNGSNLIGYSMYCILYKNR